MDRHDEPFDFDAWRELAAADPTAFERARARVLASLIESAPAHSRPRLSGLQWQLDLLRARTDNPLIACFRISDLMWDRLLGEAGLVAHVDALCNGESPHATAPRKAASVLPFARRPQPR